MELRVGNAIIELLKGDITKVKTDAIINAANSSLMGGGGVDGAIHRAGGSKILEECKVIVSKQGSLPTGEAVITTSGNMPSDHVIHTVGPVWHGGSKNEEELLKNAYFNSLLIGSENKLKSIAFPSISTGIYGYPIEKACMIALDTIIDFICNEESYYRRIIFVVFSDADYKVYEEMFIEHTKLGG